MPNAPEEPKKSQRDEANSPRGEAQSQRSVLQILGEKSGFASKVLLSDADSEAGASPIVDPAAAAKLVPQGRGNYQLLGEIARGGMGVILKGHDTDLGRDIAVKVLSKEMAARPTIVQRFIEEAQIGGQLQHPGIVPVYELGLMADDCPYFTMKLVKGRTLAALLAKRKSPAEDRGRLLAIFESVCQTVAYAHSKGVLHRDLKPANVMVGAFGEVQVVDWGLAKVLRRGGVADEKRAKESLHTVIETVRSGPRGSGGSGSSGSDSLVGSVMGTPAYMAPRAGAGRGREARRARRRVLARRDPVRAPHRAAAVRGGPRQRHGRRRRGAGRARDARSGAVAHRSLRSGRRAEGAVPRLPQARQERAPRERGRGGEARPRLPLLRRTTRARGGTRRGEGAHPGGRREARAPPHRRARRHGRRRSCCSAAAASST
ncbi:MAG: serine/threonine protein kinase [Planctomycetes bacterium]|nr:serine/threonine protein kinase [Planctomycetota bacterium]